MYQGDNNIMVLHIAPIQYPINDQLRQGGTERVVYFLGKEFKKLRVNSVVACCNGSNILGTEYIAFRSPLSESCGDLPVTYENHMKEYEFYFDRVLDYALKNKISILHDHTGWFLLSKVYERRRKQISFPILTTIASSYAPYLKDVKIYSERKKDGGIYFCVVSSSQMSLLMPHLKVDGMVYNGINVAEFPFEPMENKKGYLLSLGRICSLKGQHIAINVARRSGLKLAIGGSIHDPKYFKQLCDSYDIISLGKSKQNKEDPQEIIDNFLKSKADVIYIGQPSDIEKMEWYKYASCFLMPILWEEPFGLVMIEAMACGTPVVGFNRGSVPETLKDGKTGFIVETEQQMVEALKKVCSLDSYACRNWVEHNFTSSIMAQNYLQLYYRIIEDYRLKFSLTKRLAAPLISHS